MFCSKKPVFQALNRIEPLQPEWVHPLHGGSLSTELATQYVRALRRKRCLRREGPGPDAPVVRVGNGPWRDRPSGIAWQNGGIPWRDIGAAGSWRLA